MMVVIVLGIILISLTVILHIGGTVVWALLLHRRHGKKLLARQFENEMRASILQMIHIFVQTVVVILCLHIIEVILWAVTYYFIPHESNLNDFRQCVYFSIVTYTTLGYGDVVIIDENWRLLAGIQAMGGMLVFGWSSALLFGAVQQTMTVSLLRK